MKYFKVTSCYGTNSTRLEELNPMVIFVFHNLLLFKFMPKNFVRFVSGKPITGELGHSIRSPVKPWLMPRKPITDKLGLGTLSAPVFIVLGKTYSIRNRNNHHGWTPHELH